MLVAVLTSLPVLTQVFERDPRVSMMNADALGLKLQVYEALKLYLLLTQVFEPDPYLAQLADALMQPEDDPEKAKEREREATAGPRSALPGRKRLDARALQAMMSKVGNLSSSLAPPPASSPSSPQIVAPPPLSSLAADAVKSAVSADTRAKEEEEGGEEETAMHVGSQTLETGSQTLETATPVPATAAGGKAAIHE